MSIWRFTSGPSWPLFLLLACTVTFFVIGVWSPSLVSWEPPGGQSMLKSCVICLTAKQVLVIGRSIQYQLSGV